MDRQTLMFARPVSRGAVFVRDRTLRRPQPLTPEKVTFQTGVTTDSDGRQERVAQELPISGLGGPGADPTHSPLLTVSRPGAGLKCLQLQHDYRGKFTGE